MLFFIHLTSEKQYVIYIRKNDNIHLTEEGIQAYGKKVAQVIMDVAKTLD